MARYSRKTPQPLSPAEVKRIADDAIVSGAVKAKGATNAYGTQSRQEGFIACIKKGYSIGKACGAVGIVRQTARNWQQNAEFQKRFEDAQANYKDTLLDCLFERATDSVNRSDNLLMFTVKGAFPQYRDNFKIAIEQVDNSGEGIHDKLDKMRVTILTAFEAARKAAADAKGRDPLVLDGSMVDVTPPQTVKQLRAIAEIAAKEAAPKPRPFGSPKSLQEMSDDLAADTNRIPFEAPPQRQVE